jgi:hypothetical protein
MESVAYDVYTLQNWYAINELAFMLAQELKQQQPPAQLMQHRRPETDSPSPAR